MNFIKATIATAAVITCCLGNDYPAKANQVSQANRFCKAVAGMNKEMNQSVAPGSAAAQVLIAYNGGDDFSGYTYGQLYRLAKRIGTSRDCYLMY